MALKTFDWCVDAGASRTTDLKTNTVSFGDGYEQVSSFGINNVRESWSVTKTGYKAEIDAIYEFLVEHKGVTPFYVDIAGDTKIYRTDGSISTPHQSGNVWQISFNLKQAFYIEPPLPPFNPVALYANGSQGVWYDPSDLLTLFKDAEGTQPVTADGDPVGLMLDKSGNGNHATQTVSAARPIYKTDGILHWLAFDGVDDQLNIKYLSYSSGSFAFMCAFRVTTSKGANVLFSQYGAQKTLMFYNFGSKLNTYTRTSDFSRDVSLDKSADYVSSFVNSNSKNYRGVSAFNGTKFASGAAYDDGGLATTTPMVLGNASASYNNPLGGRIYGAIFVIDDLIDDDVDRTNAYLADKAGVTL